MKEEELKDSPPGTLCDNEGDLLMYDEDQPDGCSFEVRARGGCEADFIYEPDSIGSNLGTVVRGREERVERWMAIGRLRFGSKWDSNLFSWPDGYERE